MFTYFKIFNCAENLFIDLNYLQNKYYELCKEYHPDSKNQNIDSDINIIEINLAYNTLKDLDKRIEYLLKINSLLNNENDKDNINKDFLIEMMDINEEISDSENDEIKKENIKNKIIQIIEEDKNNILSILYDNSNIDIDKKKLNDLKLYFYRKKYLLRLLNMVN